jgi:hypothetical protein
MKIEAVPGALKRLQRPPGKFQDTFRTALDRLPVFVAALLAGTPPIASGTVTLKAIAFEPRHLRQVLERHHLSHELGPDVTITASGPQELQALLVATFSDWLDFYFVPRPNRFLVYADHDEFTTVFSARKTAISRISTAMAVAGIAEVPGYTREA